MLKLSSNDSILQINLSKTIWGESSSSLSVSESEKRDEARFSNNSVLKTLKSNSNLKVFIRSSNGVFANDNSAIQHQKTARI
jgi:hypothetical protein